MAQTGEPTRSSEQGDGLSIVIVPEHLRAQVLSYVKELTANESDVSGFMMGSALSSSLTGGVMASSSGSGCKFVDSKKGFDWQCFDHDA